MEQVKSNLETLSTCPVCSGTNYVPFLSCIDYTVSYETFQIVECIACGFKFTNPRPSEEEIGKYYDSSDYISHSNTSKGIINSLYKITRRFTISKKVRLIKSVCPDGKSILDYGCGTGEFLSGMKKVGWSTKGIEPNPEARNYAINTNLLEVTDPSEIISFRPKSFDAITLWHVLEHIHKLNETIEVFKKLLSDDGKLIIAVPNNEAVDALIYKETWAAYDVPRHLYHFNVDSITRLFRNHQMQVLNVMLMPLDAFYVSMLSEKYRNKTFGIINGVLNGAKTNLKSRFDKKKSSSLIFVIDKLK